MITPDRIEILRQKLEPVYARLDPPDMLHPRPWTQGNCFRWSFFALPIAQEVLGVTEDQISLNSYCPDAQASGTYHALLVEHSEPDKPWVIDGTYQQFSCGRVPRSLSHIMVAAAVESPKVLRTAKIDPMFWPQWRPDLYPNNFTKTF